MDAIDSNRVFGRTLAEAMVKSMTPSDKTADMEQDIARMRADDERSSRTAREQIVMLKAKILRMRDAAEAHAAAGFASEGGKE